jgi:hypothetical protein
MPTKKKITFDASADQASAEYQREHGFDLPTTVRHRELRRMIHRFGCIPDPQQLVIGLGEVGIVASRTVVLADLKYFQEQAIRARVERGEFENEEDVPRLELPTE